MAKKLYTLITETIAEDLAEWKKFRNLELQHKQEKKNGALSLSYHTQQIESQIYNQLVSLNIEDLTQVKNSFSEKDWKHLTSILTNYQSTPNLNR